MVSAASPASVQSLINLETMLEGAFRVRASDVHFRVGQSPRYRVAGSLRSFDIPPMDDKQMAVVIQRLLTAGGKTFEPSDRDLEFSVQLAKLGRFRVSVFRESGRLAVVMRAIPNEVPNLKDLRLPAVLKRVGDIPKGLILVTGSTGMGKSTTCAALLNLISQSAAHHILTIEDPVEFVIPAGEGTVTQREIGRDVESYESGLRYALRQDPDVLFIGELLDRDTVALALQAAESGHLVLSTFHTASTVSTISRLIGLFPLQDQPSIRYRLSACLALTLGQKLLPRAGTASRIVAAEVMIPTPSIIDAMRDPAKLASVEKHIANGRYDTGMQTFDQHLVDLVQAKLITVETARGAATHPNDLVRSLTITR